MQYYNEDHILSRAVYKTGSSKNYSTTPFMINLISIYTHTFLKGIWLVAGLSWFCKPLKGVSFWGLRLCIIIDWASFEETTL